MKKKHSSRGFSLVEVVLAAAIFMLFSTSAVVVVLGGLNANRLGGEETVANQFAAEGIEAAKSIKNQAYSNLNAVNPTPRAVFRNASNIWAFGTDRSNNTLTHNVSDNYVRQVKVESVNRDGSGNIVPAPTGTLDPDTKKITSTVNWNFNAARPENISLITYLSDWRKTIAGDSAILAYADTINTPTTPKYRTYTNSSNTFITETGTVAGAIGRNFIVRTSPTKREAIVGYVDNAASGVLRVMCFDGTAWTNDWSVTVGGSGTTRRFDIAYETNSGDVLVLYSTNAGTNELDYRTKAGSLGCGSANWVDQPAFDSPGTTGVVQWVKMAWDRRPSLNLISAIWADANAHLQGAMWSDIGWTQRTTAMETSLEVVAVAQDVDDFDVEFESTSGDVLVVWANSAGDNGTNGIRYMTCPGGIATCTWGPVTTPPTFRDDAHNLDISANPNDDQIIFASIGDDGNDLQVGRWDGTAWANVANKDNSSQSPVAGSKNVATGWVISGATTRGIVVYHDSVTTGAIRYVHMTPGATPTWSSTQTGNPAPTMGTTQRWYDIQMDPVNKDTLMLTASNTVFDLFAKRLVMSATPAFTWTDANSGVVLETDLGQATAGPFGFAYWRNP